MIKPLEEDSYKSEIKYYLKNCEERYIWYRDELAKSFKEKYGDQWYKDHLKEMKSIEEKTMKEYRLEMEILNVQLNSIRYDQAA